MIMQDKDAAVHAKLGSFMIKRGVSMCESPWYIFLSGMDIYL
jgi:hypothetical protein